MQISGHFLREQVSVDPARPAFTRFLMLICRLKFGLVSSDEVEETTGLARLSDNLFCRKCGGMLSVKSGVRKGAGIHNTIVLLTLMPLLDQHRRKPNFISVI